MIFVSNRWTEEYKLDFNTLRLMNDQIFENNFMFSQILNDLQRFNIYSKYIKRDKNEREIKHKLQILSDWYTKIGIEDTSDDTSEMQKLFNKIKEKFPQRK